MAVTPDQVYGDAEWLRSNPALVSKFSQILINSGIIPDAATLSKYGLSSMFDPSVSSAAANNPYSEAAQLKNQLSGSLTGNAHAANRRGGLFSGAFKNMQDQSGRDYQQAYATAGANTLSGLLGVQGEQNSLYNSIWGRRLNDATQVDPNTSVGPVAAAPAVIGAGLPQPQGAYVRTGAETPMASWKPFTPTKKKTGFAGRAL